MNLLVLSNNNVSPEFWKSKLKSKLSVCKVSNSDFLNTIEDFAPNIILFDTYFLSGGCLNWMLDNLLKLGQTNYNGLLICLSPSFSEPIMTEYFGLKVYESQLSQEVIAFIDSKTNAL